MASHSFPIPTVLVVAGSDSSGGAGLQADLKTCLSLGAFATTVVTAVTAQGPEGIIGVEPISADVVRAQFEATLSHVRPGAVKVGMLANAEIVEIVVASLRKVDIPIVVDPVLAATSGASLLDVPGQVALAQTLLPLATVTTPNHDEATHLGGPDGPSAWAEHLGTPVLVTGGHNDGAWVEDHLHRPDGTTRSWRNPRIMTRRSRGTGCVLSSAIAVGLSLGKDLDRATGDAIRFTRDLLDRSGRGDLGGEIGPLLHPPIEVPGSQ